MGETRSCGKNRVIKPEAPRQDQSKQGSGVGQPELTPRKEAEAGLTSKEIKVRKMSLDYPDTSFLSWEMRPPCLVNHEQVLIKNKCF